MLHRTVWLLLPALALLHLSCSKRNVGGVCHANDDCQAGQVCAANTCRQVCHVDRDCDAGCCESGLCTDACGRQPPQVTTVNGTGSPDGQVDHAALHLQDRLVLQGKNLQGASVTLEAPGATPLQLEICESTADTLIAQLPSSVLQGSYTLVVANQAGSCSVATTLLQGEMGPQGPQGPPGSYVVGDGLEAVGSDLSLVTCADGDLLYYDGGWQCISRARAEFRRYGPFDFHTYDDGLHWGFSSIIHRGGNPEKAAQLAAPLGLPHGARITRARCYVTKGGDEGAQLRMQLRIIREISGEGYASQLCAEALSGECSGTFCTLELQLPAAEDAAYDLCTLANNRFRITGANQHYLTLRARNAADDADVMSDEPKFRYCTVEYTAP